MWKLWNKLFGWDYIAWQNTADQGVARVFQDGNGTAFYFRYKTIRLTDTINKPSQVVWLTCQPSKYMKVS